MIDRIRNDIQERLDQLLAEADRLRQALSALGGEREGSSGRRARTPRASSSAAASRPSRNASSSRARSTNAGSRTSSSSRGTRAAAGGTKNAVVKALRDSGEAMTASEVAAATGLGRASVSTTLSKLARSGEVNKADRGYRLSGGQAGGAAAQSGAESAS